MPKKPLGRPPIPAKDRLRRRVHTALTTEQEAVVKRAAERDGLGLSDWLRKVAMKAAG